MKIVAENILFQYPVEYLDKPSLFSRKKLTGCGWSEVKIKKKNWNYRLLNKNCRKCDLRWRKQKSKWIRRNFASQLLYKNGWRLRINTKRNIFSIGNSWLWTKCKMQKKQWVYFAYFLGAYFFDVHDILINMPETILATGIPLKIMENAFYFTLKALFGLKVTCRFRVSYLKE